MHHIFTEHNSDHCISYSLNFQIIEIAFRNHQRLATRSEYRWLAASFQKFSTRWNSIQTRAELTKCLKRFKFDPDQDL